ncbi:MAG: chorismate synthase [Bacteroidales bacterium]|jgi:chorismate synthase|nr:chorismate synthase [Bacteroidales bacterium]
MSGNSIGKSFCLTTFGESHSPFIGGVIDGCPSNIFIDENFIFEQVERRKPKTEGITTARKEEDKVEFISGIEEGLTLGSPICFIVKNNNVIKDDYPNLNKFFRPSHADYVFYSKYGINSKSGGGRASARETLTRVIGGSIARILLNKETQIRISSKIEKIGRWDFNEERDKIEEAFEKINKEGDSLGGVISCTISGVPIGLGEPVFDKLSCDLAKAVMSIPLAKAFELGEGFLGCEAYGSQFIDYWNEDYSTKTNHSSGIVGGISNGGEIFFKVGFHPLCSIYRKLPYIDTNNNIVELENKGRYDRCPILRMPVIVESMAALVLADHYLRNKNYKR